MGLESHVFDGQGALFSISGGLKSPVSSASVPPSDDEATRSTVSSYIESPDSASPVNVKGLDNGSVTLNASYATLDRLEDGSFLNRSFSNLSEHVEAGLPPVSIVEDAAIAPKLSHGDALPCPALDDLVRDGARVTKESMVALSVQIFIPFLLAGFGMVGAGLLLDSIQDWAVFVEISEIFIMVPALLGLKGNLEMTLGSRLSTQVNTGGFEDPKRKWRIIGCNVALNQVLASGVGFLASLFAIAMYAINHDGSVVIKNVVLLLGTSVVTACSTSVIQDSVMIFIVLMARRYRLNPDNIVTPVAGAIGDILTLGILVGFSMLFYSAFQATYWMVGPVVSVSVIALLLPLWIWISRKEPSTRHVLMHGWLPVILAMLISSCSGIILEKAVSSGKTYFKDLPVFQPLINGVGGNIVSVQASRIATYLHLAYVVPGRVPPGYTYWKGACAAFCSRSNINARTARLLILMVIPGHLIFLFVISFAHPDSTAISLRFAFVFLVMALIQVFVLLYVADILTHFVWKKALDPDSTTIPYLTSMGDLLGTGLLALGLFLLWVTSKNTDKIL